MGFKDCLREKRVAAGLSQAKLAKAVHVTARTIQNYELGYRKPANMEVVQKMADMLQTTTGYLLGGNADVAYEEAASKTVCGIDELVNQLVDMFSKGNLNDDTIDGAMKAINDAYWAAKEKSRRCIHKSHQRAIKKK